MGLHGFDWSDYDIILKLEQVINECKEIKEPNHWKEYRKKIGDVPYDNFTMYFSGFDVEETLKLTNEKFSKRMKAIKMLTEKHHLPNL
ncbi:hypothetical protein A1E_02545 [Rickettsia canadensis str. McKiel]|uniref:Uncharacterized protein n=1 Tax=Rickettsia canadensis (strain McKiel) TaxID=293613 RepID=A8EYM0_RICCK|nr:hypothetical protein [Rickettsia canadensis]ABV73453.1 hypothetical protein A1E_02545 [Rickettsia canadensis str. McKiel]